MKSPFTILLRSAKNCTGATAIEYGLIAALISVALITGASTLGDTLNKKFAEIRAEQTK